MKLDSILNSVNATISLGNCMNEILSGLKIQGKCKNVEIHRHLAFFDIELAPSTPVRKLENRVKEIALGIRSKTIPIVKVLPELGVVRLQVALRTADQFSLESLYSEHVVPSDNKMLLPIVLGESEEGNKLVVDFAKHPHTLVAGGTGSGKSVLLHNIIANLIYLKSTRCRNIELYLADPKQVEFATYSHDVFNGYVTNIVNSYADVVALLEDLEKEMAVRYSIMESKGCRSIEEYPSLLSQIVVVIDEVADLMMQDKKIGVFENLIVKLAQKARAAGIYLIMATQRPSVDIITGLIKANFPARISCKTASKVDSQVILGVPGAENLLGRGDAIISNMSHDRLRFQVAFSDPKVTAKTCNFFEESAA